MLSTEKWTWIKDKQGDRQRGSVHTRLSQVPLPCLVAPRALQSPPLPRGSPRHSAKDRAREAEPPGSLISGCVCLFPSKQEAGIPG